MANEANLKKWKKGESGNPAGRPKGSKNESTLIQRELTERILSNKKLGKRLDNVLDRALEKAENGDNAMMKFFLNKFIPESNIAFGKDENGNSTPAITINIQSKEEEQGVVIENNSEDSDDC